MEYSFPRYLLSKQSVDDRALNRYVLDALSANLTSGPIRIIEIGAGMGNMLARLLSWNIITRAEYVHVDAMAENIRFAGEWIPKWAADAKMRIERPAAGEVRISDDLHDVHVWLRGEEVFDFIGTGPAPADLLIAHAFLDLLPMPESMPKLLSLTKGLAWFTLNFDGVTSFEPTIDATLDDKIERLYHRTMDTRPSGGDSRAGRHLLRILQDLGTGVLAAGSSDWIVYAVDGKYPADEAYFLRFILHFFEESLTGHPELQAYELARWLDVRRGQIDRGELSYMAHQLDFLVRV